MTDPDTKSHAIVLSRQDPASAAHDLEQLSDEDIVETLTELGPPRSLSILRQLSSERRHAIAGKAAAGQLWLSGEDAPAGSIGELIEQAPAVFAADTTVGECVDALQLVVPTTTVIYIFVVDQTHRLTGVVAFRELLFGARDQRLHELMIDNPFRLYFDQPVVEAMNAVVVQHFPVYPVCDRDERLVGVVSGQVLFERHAFSISAQAGAMVGVEREERVTTPFWRSLRLRHPWLQVNLFTAFVAAFVVGLFENTVDEIVLLAVFLPVLSGQCSNTGCQTLAVTLRGMALGELHRAMTWKLLSKEALLGLFNGAMVGLLAGAAMFAVASLDQHPAALTLGIVTWLAMGLSCLVSGIAGAAVPIVLKRLGADPAQASSIFLTTATDVVSMGFFLGLAAWWVL